MDVRAVEKIIKQMIANPKDVKFSDLCKVCDYYFGQPRSSGSHRIYKTPWQGDPRINIQDDNGKGKAYQVKQVLRTIRKQESKNG
jgi:predicted RNA binding protein YcfA (HicA-like mRNA interferase family)